MTDPSTQYNIIYKLGKYKSNPVAEEFAKRVQIVKTRVPWDKTQETEVVVIWSGDKSGHIKYLRVIKTIELEPINEGWWGGFTMGHYEK